MLLIVSIFLFAISLPILVYHKYCTVLDVWEKPPLFQNPIHYMAYGLVRIAILLASVAGLWYTLGIIPALVGLAIYFVVGTVALRVSYQKQIAKWMVSFTDTIRKDDRLAKDAPLSPVQVNEARALAAAAVARAMRGES